MPAHVHVAFFRWKPGTNSEAIEAAMARVRALVSIPGLLSVHTGPKYSDHDNGYQHAVVVIGSSAAAIDAYRQHPDHRAVANEIAAMYDEAVGLDFVDT